MKPDDKRALKLENNYVSICEKNLIICDFSLNQSLLCDDSTFSLLESSKYFVYRILRSDILNKENGREWATLIRENFDEKLLPELRKIAEVYDRDCKTNYYLNQSKISEIKLLVKNNSLIEELDLVFVYNDTLYIYDLKNYGLARNTKQCKRIVNSHIRKEFTKLNKLKSKILSNKSLFEKSLVSLKP